MRALLCICFTISGAAALGLEVLWVRSASLVLGATAVTASVVLATYFTGLGVGAALARTTRERPVARYGRLELGVAAGAAWSVAVFHVLTGPGAQHVLAAAGLAGCALCVAVAILPATVCLGATLPALGQAVAAGSVGRRGGLLYALNTAGGALGIAAMGFGLPAAIGVTASYGVALCASALVGLVALLVGDATVAVAMPASGRSPVRLRLVAAGAGALGLGLEVLWIRLFAQVLHNSVYSFAAVTLVFLVALALGAALAAVVLGRTAPTTVAGGALLAAVVTTIGGVWVFVRMTDGLRYVGMATGLPEYLLRIVGLAAATAGPGAVASGAVLPALWAAFEDRTAARPLGDLAAANTFGAVVGALGAAFVVLPLVGLRGGFLLAAATYLVLADVVVGPGRSPVRALGYLALLLAVALDPVRAPLTHLADGESLRALTEGPAGIVTVVDTCDDLQLRLDNYYVLGGSAAATNERRQGLLPLLLHPAPRRVAFIGMATGITASAGPALGVERTTVVEVVPEVVTAASAYFGAWNAALLRRPDADVVVGDGRRWLAAGSDDYDVIVADLFIPWHAGAGTLYTRETFASARRRLAPGGVFCQWLPLYQLTREEFDGIARTFRTVFPDVTVWRNDFYPDRPVVALVGRDTPAAVDFTRVGERLAVLPDWSRDPLLALPQGLAMLYVGDLRAAGDVVANGPLNTDDRPLIEFLAPRLTRMSAAGDKDWFTGEALAAFTETVAERDASPAALPPTADVRAARRAGAALFRYALAARSGDTAAADRYEETVRGLVPEVVALGERTSSVATLADTRRTLDTLRTEQQRVARELDAMEQRLGQLTGGDE